MPTASVLQWPSWVVITDGMVHKALVFTVWPFAENICHPCSKACVLSHYTNLLLLNFHIHLVTNPANFSKMFQMWLYSYLHCNCLSSGSCELCQGDKISCPVTSVLPSQTLDSFYTDAYHPFPRHNLVEKGVFVQDTEANGYGCLRAGGG